jgi:hypothetical protein
MSRTLLILGSVSSILFSNVALAQAPNIEGNWKMSFTAIVRTDFLCQRAVLEKALVVRMGFNQC